MAGTDTPSDDPGEILPNFADFVVGMSRLLVGFANMAPFRAADFSLASWVALSVLAKGPAKNNRQLAKALGVTRQRANQIKTSLERARLISATQSSEDARQNVIMVTARGQAQLDDINAKILAVLSPALKDKARVLVSANGSLRMLMRIARTHQAAATKTPPDRRKTRRRLAGRLGRASI